MDAVDGATADGCDIKASAEAVAFMSSIEPSELQTCIFTDILASVSQTCRSLGGFRVEVEFYRRDQEPCVRVSAQSHGAIDGCRCGTEVTAYLSSDLSVLEEETQEYIKLQSHTVDKKCHLLQRDGEMEITTVITVGEEVTKESISYPLSALQGLVTEGSSLLLMRIIALRKKVPQNMSFVSFDQNLHIIQTTFSELGVKMLEVEGENFEAFGLERSVHSLEDGLKTWQCYFLHDGHLASREQVGAPVTMRLLQLPLKAAQGALTVEKIPLVLEEDMQMHSEFLRRKEAIKADDASYLRQNPEIRELICDFLQALLLRKPEDVSQFARDYFLPFASHCPTKQHSSA
ncbi:ciliogenesis-associated TTC17-interacting protein [Gouania willdenowi]|uniref:Ciliogenesis-associated TTC17-interacting protein n=1 Tax=Gouania willdenowi TaxID=441366 RepID=A0A8C5NFX9_GOUWI|nr:ciliogenesis-associated TTC17-interacting protein [Gouania willdenowi]